MTSRGEGEETGGEGRAEGGAHPAAVRARPYQTGAYARPAKARRDRQRSLVPLHGLYDSSKDEAAAAEEEEQEEEQEEAEEEEEEEEEEDEEEEEEDEETVAAEGLERACLRGQRQMTAKWNSVHS
jgi:hypothetical protein